MAICSAALKYESARIAIRVGAWGMVAPLTKVNSTGRDPCIAMLMDPALN